MMNDRFDAQLRQHLLDFSDERPAEGQLAAVIDRVADTAQRHPIVARLASPRGLVPPLPRATLRWAFIAAALLAATLAVAMLGGGGPTRSTVFEGAWTTIDATDGSRMSLVVGAGLSPAVTFEDDFAAGPACAADPVKIFRAAGTGQISGGNLATSFPDGGGCGSQTVEVGPGVLAYDGATDTITGADDLTWSRASGLASQRVIISSAMTDAPSGVNSGTFETSGAASEGGQVCPAGVVTDLNEIDSAAVGRGELLDFTVFKQFVCDDGSGTFAATLEIHVDFELGIESFTWVITEGTGAYAGLRGEGYGGTQSPAPDQFVNTYWGSVRDGGGPTRTPEPAASQAPATQPPSIEPSPVTSCLDLTSGENGFDIDGVVPWVTFSNVWHAVDLGFHHLEAGRCDSTGAMRLDLGMVNEVYADICTWTDTGVALDDPTTTVAFSALEFEVTRSSDSTIADFPAARFDFSVPADFDTSACDSQTTRLWGDGPAVDPGQDATVMLLRVDNISIGVAGTTTAEASASQRAELQAILDTLRIVQ